MSSIYRRGGVWQIQFMRDGKQVQRSLHTKLKADAKALQREIDAQLGMPVYHYGPAVEPRPQTIHQVVDLVAAFDAHADGYYRKGGEPTSTLNRIRTVLDALRPHGNMDVNDFRPSALRRVRDSWVSAGLARSTVNHYHAVLVQIFRWGVGQEMVRPETLTALEAVEMVPAGRGMARETDRVQPVSDEHLEAVRALATPLVRDMIDLQVLTCARPGELRLLRVGDIDRTAEVWTANVAGHKTAHKGKVRTLYFGPQSQAVLARHLVKAPHQLVFPVSEQWLRVEIRKLCGQAGIPAWSPNQLRHLGATRVRAAVNAETASVLLGHSNLSTTEIYAEKNEATARAAALMLG